ncbi:hypothetical protein RHRU231_680028 [Rhodococcus ruber]|uniref:Transposase IS204/IS1001/IS1096/IS1165 DDE domain-containing protein n=1 Tax=Rhodococcus ruber TaxID=1830 RepID=A0A098BNE3_9NOCA|nr:hypothetical protein RHRU231_680028 [Rhodococcus ruber]
MGWVGVVRRPLLSRPVIRWFRLSATRWADLSGCPQSIPTHSLELTPGPTVQVAVFKLEHPALHRASLLKESLRLVFQMRHEDAVVELDRRIGWARRCQIPEFVALQRSTVTHRDSILTAIEHGLPNGRIKSVNTKIRLITRVAIGFRSPEASLLWPCSDSAAIHHNYQPEITHE